MSDWQNEIKRYYRDNKTGALVEKSGPSITYDTEYVSSRYDTYPTTGAMSELRWSLILSKIDPMAQNIDSVLDFGCGNGDFLKRCWVQIGNNKLYAIEASDYPLGKLINRVEEPVPCDLFTCFDSLEHLEDPRALLAKVQSPYVCISLPWCHERTLGMEWFMGWKHRRPGEHLWHFDHISLPALLSEFGYKLIYCGNPEDEIRKGDGKLPNILTCLFQK